MKLPDLKPFLERNTPPGINIREQLNFFVAGYIFAGLYASLFMIGYGNSVNNLYVYRYGEKMLTGEMMPYFAELIENWHYGYLLLAVASLIMIIVNYAYHYGGSSKSIYLMRRLPDRFELVRRCVTLPLIMFGIAMLGALLCILFWFAVYMIFTPDVCIRQGQWSMLMEELLC